MREIGENIVSSRSGATPRPLTKTRGPAASANGPSRYDSAPAQMTQVAAASASASEEPSRESRLRSSGRRASERQGPLSNAWATKLAAVVLALVTGTAMLWIGAPPAFASSPPTVTAVIASSGPTTGAQRVTVMGTNLASPTSVKFGATSATILSSTATTDTVTSPVGSIGTVDVTVTTSGGTSATSSADQYSYVEAPTAYVTGTNTVTPITIASNTPGTAITVGSGPYFIAITPDQAPTASFTVTPALAGAATSFDGSASGAPYGSITNYAWTFGDTATANTSTPTTTHTYATGGGYTATLTVTDSAGTSSTQVFTGQTVSNNGGVSAVASQSFTLPPTVSAVSPNAGPLGGGTVVTITGSGFVPGSTTVAFGAGAGTSVSCLATSCTATSPAESAGVVDVTVTTAGGTSATGSADHFTYDATPSVTAVSPAAGPITGATVVTITGTGFADAIATGGVTFAGTSATSYTINSDTSITATSPAHAAGVADVVVTNETGASSTSSADHFSYEALPSVTAISPAAGTTNGGDVVTITGTGFVVGSTTVAFGAGAGTSVTCTLTTSCSATSPAGSAGVVDLTVTTAGGTSTISSADHFTYDATPSVTAVSPAAGPIAGGTVVTVTGSNFTGASVVDFGSNPATAYTVNSATQITVTSPPAVASTVDITVTNPVGTSATSAADQFTYQLIPTLTAIATSPSASEVFGSSLTMTATVSAGATGSVDFEYSSDGTTYTAVPGCVPKTISGTTATCTTTSLPGGTEYLEAVYMGDASYATSTSAPSGFAVSAAAQTITFTSRPPAVPTVGGTYTLGATAPGGSVSFSLDAASSGCSLSGAIVTFTGVGTCVIDASSPAGNDYLAAAGKQSIVISQSPPGPGLGSITSVIASPGDRQALVSWSAPSNVSQFQNVSYTVTASPGGASCSSTGTLFCMVNGLSDSVRYTFTVTASSKDPTFSSITSPSSSPVTPTAAPLQTWATTTPELSPGSAEVVSSSGSMTKVAVKLSGDSVVAAGEGLKVAIATSATTGQGTHATVVLITGGTAWLKGSGFLGGSVIDFYVFSRGTLLGTAVAKSNGTCSATLRVPSGLVVGSHTIQVQGFATSHKRLAIAVGVIVLKSMKLSVVLAKFGVCDPGLKASMKTQLSKLAATIYAQGASSVVITGYTYSTGTWAKRLVHTQAVAAAEYLRASLQHLGYNRAVRIVIGVGRAASQALSRRVTMAVTLG